MLKNRLRTPIRNGPKHPRLPLELAQSVLAERISTLAGMFWTDRANSGIIRAVPMPITLQTIGWILGGLLSGLAVVRGMAFAVQALLGKSRQRLRREARREDFSRRVDAKAREASASLSLLAWDGWRPFRLAGMVHEAEEIKSFTLTPCDERPLPPFEPGQYLTFRVQPPGQSKPVVRCYSLSDHPRKAYYRCTIQRAGAPAGRSDLPPGQGSSFFHDHAKVGDVVDVRAPQGTFFLDPLASGPIVLLGAGIGVTPLLSMLNATLQAGTEREIYVLFGFRHSRAQPFREHLEAMAQKHPNVRRHVFYSAPLEGDRLHRDYNQEGRVTFERVREILPANNFHFYLCGPGPMMESLVPALLEWGVPNSHIHFEAFGPASVKLLGTPWGQSSEPPTDPWDIRFDQSGKTLAWNGTHASLLEFGEANGIAIASGCRAGSCGECLTAIREGEARAVKPSGVPLPPGHCLPCICVPTGALVLDA